jgi:hypothetical protein
MASATGLDRDVALAGGIGIWSLEFLWSLVFGIWSFFPSIILFFALGCIAQETPAASPMLYQNDFEKATNVPDDFLVLEGAFGVKEEGGNKFLELPGAPLDTFGVLFGPTENSDVAVSARIFGTGKGRRFPTFGVGLNGVGGYRLQVSPGKKALELYKSEEILATVAYTWESESWTMLRLQVRKTKEGGCKIEGKAWKQGSPEPAAWNLSHQETTEPTAGRASVWGAPYATTPIRFDDLRVTRVSGKP